MNLKPFLLATALAVASPLTHAANISGQVTAILTNLNGNLVKFELTSEDRGPECNTSGWFSINMKKPGGDRAYTMLLDAYKNQHLITVRAPKANPCSDEAGVMAVRSLMLGAEKGPAVGKRSALKPPKATK